MNIRPFELEWDGDRNAGMLLEETWCFAAVDGPRDDASGRKLQGEHHLGKVAGHGWLAEKPLQCVLAYSSLCLPCSFYDLVRTQNFTRTLIRRVMSSMQSSRRRPNNHGPNRRQRDH